MNIPPALGRSMFTIRQGRGGAHSHLRQADANVGACVLDTDPIFTVPAYVPCSLFYERVA